MARLWRGELPLAEAFWRHAVVIAAAANLFATALALALLTRGLHPAAVVAIYLTPLPYVVAAVVGVWRSAERSAASPALSWLARWGAVAWGAALIAL